jgi:ribosomal protein S18 acetylase RimI-like enzyme
MIRFIKPEELEMIVDWHFRQVDVVSGGRKLYAQKFPTEYRAAVDTLCGKTGFVLVAVPKNSIVGYIGIAIDKQSNPYRANLCGFYVEPQNRRNGYGRELANKAIETAREKGASSLSVEVGLKKQWLITFYESVGFMSSSMNMYQSLGKSSNTIENG